jgi:peptidoglycan/xylan/chitin deacetylase (PgdA/CDA1 family)
MPDVAVPVLLYHDVVAGKPDDPWAVGVDELARHLDLVLESGRTVVAASSLPAQGSGVCALTFDDGFASFADLVLPLLAQRGLSAALFVTTGLLGQPRILSRSALADLTGAPGVEFGAHAVRHRHLDLLPSAEVRAEIQGSRDELGAITGAPASFAYPHGSFSPRVRDLMPAAGYINAFAVKDALSHPIDHPYAIARLTVGAGTPANAVRSWLAGDGAPRSWPGQRLRTRAYREVRRARHLLTPGGLVWTPQ